MASGYIIGMDALKNRLKTAPETIRKAVGIELSDGAQAIAAEAKQRAPGDQGILRQEITAQKIDDLTYEVISGAEYSPYVEFGTLSKVQIPPELEEYAAQFKGSAGASSLSLKEAIFNWCARKGIDKEAWYPIYISIMTNGVKPQPFFFPAVNRITPIIINRVEKVLGDAL